MVVLGCTVVVLGCTMVVLGCKMVLLGCTMVVLVCTVVQKSTLPEMKSITCRWAVTSDTEKKEHHPLYEVSSFCSTHASYRWVPGPGGHLY